VEGPRLLAACQLWVRLFVVVAALATEKVENFLSAGTAHTASLQIWLIVLKRITMPRRDLAFPNMSASLQLLKQN
jgi:hypothetical protein